MAERAIRATRNDGHASRPSHSALTLGVSLEGGSPDAEEHRADRAVAAPTINQPPSLHRSRRDAASS